MSNRGPRIRRCVPWLILCALLITLVGCGGGSRRVTVNLTAAPAIMAPGEQAELSWTSRHATDVVSANFDAITVQGTLVVSPTETTTYTLTVGGTQGTASASVTVTVLSIPPQPQAGATPTAPFYVVTENYYYLYDAHTAPFNPASQFADRHYPIPLAYRTQAALPAGYTVRGESERSVRIWAQADPRISVISGVESGSERILVTLVERIEYAGVPNIIGLTKLISGGGNPRFEVYVATLDPFTNQPRSLDEITRTLIHEFGHAFGLGHTPDARDVMYYMANAEQHPVPERSLTLGDALAIWTTLTQRLVSWYPDRETILPGPVVEHPVARRGATRISETDGVVICIYTR